MLIGMGKRPTQSRPISSNARIFKISQAIVHENYRHGVSFDYDFALVCKWKVS